MRACLRVDWPAAHALSDQLGLTAQEQRFDAFYNLLLDHVARLVRVRATQRKDAPEFALAQRLIPEPKLAAWAALWETVLRERDETVLLNLDRKALIVGTLARLEALARASARPTQSQ